MNKESREAWKMTREDIRSGKQKYRIDYRVSAVPGTWVTEYMIDNFAAPIGSVWWRYVGSGTIDILHSYVMKPLRRCGIRTDIHKAMRFSNPKCTFVSGAASGKASRKWMKKMGYKKDIDWTLPPK